MIGFLGGVAAGLVLGGLGLVSLLSAYPRGEDVYVTKFYGGLGYLILGMAVLAFIVGVTAMAKDMNADRRRSRIEETHA